MAMNSLINIKENKHVNQLRKGEKERKKEK